MIAWGPVAENEENQKNYRGGAFFFKKRKALQTEKAEYFLAHAFENFFLFRFGENALPFGKIGYGTAGQERALFDFDEPYLVYRFKNRGIRLLSPTFEYRNHLRRLCRAEMALASNRLFPHP